jgi:hypothetical protein
MCLGSVSENENEIMIAKETETVIATPIIDTDTPPTKISHQVGSNHDASLTNARMLLSESMRIVAKTRKTSTQMRTTIAVYNKLRRNSNNSLFLMSPLPNKRRSPGIIAC